MGGSVTTTQDSNSSVMSAAIGPPQKTMTERISGIRLLGVSPAIRPVEPAAIMSAALKIDARHDPSQKYSPRLGGWPTHDRLIVMGGIHGNSNGSLSRMGSHLFRIRSSGKDCMSFTNRVNHFAEALRTYAGTACL